MSSALFKSIARAIAVTVGRPDNSVPFMDTYAILEVADEVAKELTEKGHVIAEAKDAKEEIERWKSAQVNTQRQFEDVMDQLDQANNELVNYYQGHCPHGLSRDLCQGPQHYPMDHERDEPPF